MCQFHTNYIFKDHCEEQVNDSAALNCENDSVTLNWEL